MTHHPPSYPNENWRVSQLPSPAQAQLHPNTQTHPGYPACHFNSSPSPPFLFPKCEMEGHSGMVCKVNKQCGVAGILQVCKFHVLFFLFLLTHQYQNTFQMSRRVLHHPCSPPSQSPLPSKQVEGTSLPPTPAPTPSALQLSARGLHHPLPLPLVK